MAKKLITHLVEHGDDLALIIDPSMLKKLEIDKETNLDISVENKKIIIKPAPVVPEALSNQERTIQRIGEEIMEKYAGVFKALAQADEDIIDTMSDRVMEKYRSELEK